MKSKILAFKNNRQSYKFAQHLNEHMHTFRSLDLKWSEVEWSEVKWSEVKWSEVKWSEVNCGVQKGENYFMGTFYMSNKVVRSEGLGWKRD